MGYRSLVMALVTFAAWLLLRPLRFANFASPDSNGEIFTTTVTIANGQSLSGSVDLQSYSLVGLVMPAVWTAAAITFQGSVDNVSFFDVCDQNAEINVGAAAANKYILLSPATFVGLRYLKIQSGTNAVPVNQGQESTVTLVLRGL